MSGFTTAAGISVIDVTTTQQAPLGFQLTVPSQNNGNAVYTYIRAGAAIGPGICVAKDPASSTTGDGGYGDCKVATSAMAMARYVGVAQIPIASGSYGFVLTRGTGVAKVNSLSAADDALVVHSANGELDDAAAAAANTEVGVVLGDDIAAGAIGNVYVNFAG